MSNSDSRREDRLKLKAQPKGQLLIHIRGECIPVLEVRDISTTGISLVFLGDVVESGELALEYRSKGLDLKVEGSVIWERKETDQAGHSQNVLGVQLFGPTLLLAAMLSG